MDFRGFDMIEASHPKNSPPALGMRIVALALCAGVKFLLPQSSGSSQIFGTPNFWYP